MKKFIGIVLVLCSLALPLAGCKEAISTVTSQPPQACDFSHELGGFSLDL